MNMYTSTPTKSSSAPWIIAVGAVTFAIGAVGAFAMSQMNQSRQNDAIAMLAAQLAEMQVTRAEAPDLLAITDMAAATLPAATPTSIPSASAVLAARVPTGAAPELSIEDKTANAIAIANRNKMRMLTEGVVAGLYSVTSETANGGTRIALNSRNAASTAAELENLIAQAAAAGDLTVPESISTSDGSVDSQTMLFELVQQSLEGGNADEVAAAQEMRRRAFAASAAKTEVIDGQRFYTVEAGDSLAYISLQFYGSTNVYQKIFDANRNKIDRPDQIQIGQLLLIPEA